jgi:hypothetical protein
MVKNIKKLVLFGCPDVLLLWRRLIFFAGIPARVVTRLCPLVIPVKSYRVDMPAAPPQQPVQGAGLADGEICPPENPADEDHGIVALECRVLDSIKVLVDVTVQVAHIIR